MSCKMLVIPIKSTSLTDIIPYCAGYQVCEPDDFFEVEKSEFYLLQHVVKGEGTVIINDKKYNMHENQTFLLLPGEYGKWQTGSDNCWTYNWISFTGTAAKMLEAVENRIIDNINPKLFSDLLDSNELIINRHLFAASKIFEILSCIFSVRKKWDMVAYIKDLIDSNYPFDITISSIAESIGINKQYMSRLFKQKTNMSIKEYILAARMKEARQMISRNMRLSEIYYQCGYKDVYSFSRAYKNYYGVSPKKS